MIQEVRSKKNLRLLNKGSALKAFILIFSLSFFHLNLQSQTPERWDRLPLVSEHQRTFFASKVGDPNFPEANNFLGGEGGQWPQGWAVSGDGSALLWGTDVGGIARSRDGGATWVPANYGFNARGGIAFAIDPLNPNRALAIGGNGARDFVGAHGIYLTSNLKADMPLWNQKLTVNITGYRDIREQVDYDRSSFDAAAGYCKIAYWSRGYQDWYDASTKHNAIHKTIDGGETWTELHLDVAEYNLGILKVHPTAGYVYLANKNGFYKSIDGAVSFTKTFTADITGMDVVASAGNENKVFVSTADGVYVSDNSGDTFTKVSSSNYPTTTGSFMPSSHLKVSPANPSRMMLLIQVDTWSTYKYYSHNGGASWTKIEENQYNLNYLAFLGGRVGPGLWHPTDANRAWVFGSDGMQTSFDGAVTMRWSHNGLPAVMGREFNFSTTTPGVFVIPTQDYDISVTKDNGRTWKYLNMSTYGWGGYFYGAYSSNGDVIAAIEKNTSDFNQFYINMTWDQGAHIQRFTSQLVNGFHTVLGDPHDPNIFFAGEYRSTDEGHTWTKMAGCDGVFISSPTGAKELYGATKTRKIVRSTDRGATWVPIGEVPNDVYDVAFDHLNNKAYVTTQWNLYELNIATKAVTDITSRIPADQYGGRRFYQVAVDPQDPNVVYTAGANHIYANDASVRRSTDGGLTWISLTRSPRHGNDQFGIDGGKEGEIVRVNPLTRELIVGTNCYGTWKFGPPTSTVNPGNHPDLVVTDVKFSPSNPKSGDLVTLTATIKNIGTTATAAGENLKVRFTVGETAVFSGDYTSALPVDGSVDLSATWTAITGSNIAVAVVDSDGAIIEKREDNNKQSASVVVTSSTPPTAPANLQVVSKSMNTILVSWDAVAGSIGYRLYLNGQYVELVSGTTFTFSGLTRYTEYTVDVRAIDETGQESPASQVKVFTEARAAANSVPKTSQSINVDGSLDESAWTLNFSVNKNLDGASNNTTTYGMLWTDDSVYVGVKVLDATIDTSNTDLRQKDGVQIYINGNKSSDPIEQWYWSNDMIFGKVAGNDASLYEIWSYGDLHMNIDDVKHKTKIIPGGYTMEISIPWGRGDQFRGIGWESGFVGKKIGVDVWNIDNDGSGRSILNWNGRWENEWKGEFLGEVTLGAEGGDAEAPSVPANVTGTPGATKITLNWSASTDNQQVAEYFIYQNGQRVAEVPVVAGNTQSYVVAGLEQGTAYKYQLKAVDETGNVSDFSSEITVTTLIDNQAPTAPSDLVASNLYSTNVTLAWTASADNFGVTEYIVYSDTTLLLSTNQTTVKVAGLSPLTSYNFSVKAKDEVGNVSAASSVLIVTTPDHKLAKAAIISSPVTIDGMLNESVWTNTVNNDVVQNLEGTTNNDIKFGTLWDNSNLYVAVKVLDAQVHANAGQFWSTDALEVYIDPNNSRKVGYDADDRQFTRVIFHPGTFGSGGLTQQGVAHAWDTVAGGYILEMSIPWTNLGITPVAGMKIGFDLGNNDDDNGGGRDGVSMWNGTGDNWRSTEAFGRLELAAPDTGRLNLTSVCSADPAKTRRWRITSTFATPVDFSWELYGTTQKGQVSVGGAGTTYLETNTVAGANTLIITYRDNKKVTKASSGETCRLNLTSVCSADPAVSRRWMVTNNATYPVNFSWNVFGTSQVGTGQVGPLGTVHFETQTVSGPNTTVLTYDITKSVVKASGGKTCSATSRESFDEEKVSQTGIGLFPNPAASDLTVTYFSERRQSVRIELLDALSKVKISKTEEAQPGLNQSLMKVSQVEGGIYIVQVILGEKRLVNKVIIKK